MAFSIMKTVPFGMVGVAAATGLLIFSCSLRAQSDDGFEPEQSRLLAVAVDYGNEAVFKPDKHDFGFDQLGLRPQQTVTITVQFPVELAGTAVVAEPLDGGSVLIPEKGLVVGSEGTAVFQFQGGLWVGASRLSVHVSDDRNLVNFWLVDAEHPENTPSDLPGAY